MENKFENKNVNSFKTKFVNSENMLINYIPENVSVKEILPDEPRHRLDEYLQEIMIREYGKGNDRIRIYGIRSTLRKFASGNSRKFLAQQLGLTRKNLDNWIGESKRDVGIPIQTAILLAELTGKTKEDLFEVVSVFGCTNSKKYTLPKSMTPKLAYLLGYLMGDGHLANPTDLISNGSFYNAEVKITTGDEDHILFLRDVFKELFNYIPPLYPEGNFFKLICRSKVIHLFLSRVCGIPTGNKKTKTCVPKIIKNNIKYMNWFLSGFLDSDGTVYINKLGRIVVCIKQYNRKILLECEEYLKSEEIFISGIYQDNGIRNGTPTRSYVLKIYRNKEIEKFLNKITSFKTNRVISSRNQNNST